MDRGINPSIVDSPKTILLEGDADLPGFGLDDGALLELRSIITCILHIGMPEAGFGVRELTSDNLSF